MPIECALLENEPVKLSMCPNCGAEPFEPFLRGMIQRRQKRFWFSGERDYCALICSECKEIVGYESPPEFS